VTGIVDKVMKTCRVMVVSPLGVHARRAGRIVQVASGFRSNISLYVNGRKANARNIIAVMLLAAGVGSTISIETTGPDEADAMDAIARVIGDEFR